MTTTSDLALIALDPATGKRRLGSYGEVLLGGAAFSDLLLMGRLVAVGEGRKARAAVADPTPTGTAYLDGGLARLAARTKPRRTSDVVARLGRKLPRTVYEALVADGLVEDRSTRTWCIVPSRRYTPLPQARRDELASGVRAVLLGEREPDERHATLGALLVASRQTRLVVPKGRRKEAEKRAKTLTDGAWASEGVRAAINATENAMMVAVLAATTAAGGGAAS